MGLGSFLEDVDKANLPQRVGALTKGLSDIQQLETNKIQQKNYLADIEVKERAARLADYEWQKIQEEEAWQKKKFKVNDLFGISPSDVPDNMRFPKAGEGFKNWAIDFAQKSRLAEVNPQTGELEISIENHARAIKMFGENMEIQKDGLIATLADVSKNLSIAEASLPEIKKPGDRKKAEEDIADMKMMKNAITEQVNILDTELRGKLELEKVKPDTATPQTDDIKEYEYAVKQGYKGTLRDFMLEGKKAGRASTGEGKEPSRIAETKAVMEFYKSEGKSLTFQEAYNMVKSSVGTSREEFMRKAWMEEYELSGEADSADKIAETAGMAYDRISGSREQPRQAKEEYEVGKIYTDANGREAKYLGKGKWELQ